MSVEAVNKRLRTEQVTTTASSNLTATVLYNVLPVYRWYQSTSYDHFFCLDPKGEIAPQVGYASEGIGFYTLQNQELGAVPLYRLWNSNGGHFYTSNQAEHNYVVTQGWNDEGIIGYVFTGPVPGTVAIERYYNPQFNKHFYTVNPKNEILGGWNDEGVVGYGFGKI